MSIEQKSLKQIIDHRIDKLSELRKKKELILIPQNLSPRISVNSSNQITRKWRV